MTRLVALVLLMMWLQPLEAGWPFRRKSTPAQRMKNQQRAGRAQYGAEAYRKKVKEGRSRKVKPPEIRAKATGSR
ncbi:MAG: hypothetical protein SFV51_26160 [Bryobacteraceae bacterium]|nr:hypothetical protein [Bryobacteraceae bacterium]